MSGQRLKLKPEPFDPLELWLFRIVPMEILPELFEKGQLCPPGKNDLASYERLQLAEPNMIPKRKRRTTPDGVSLHEHVAFYFAPRSPMLYRFYKGNHPNAKHPYDRIVYLVTQVKNLVSLQEGNYWFSDMNAVLNYARFSSELAELKGMLDFAVLEAKDFNRTEDDPERSQTRQAEFLFRAAFLCRALRLSVV